MKRPVQQQHAKYGGDRHNRCRDIANLGIFKMAAAHQLGFVGHVFGPPTMSTWWSLVLCKSWLVGIDAVVLIIYRFQYFAR